MTTPTTTPPARVSPAERLAMVAKEETPSSIGAVDAVRAARSAVQALLSLPVDCIEPALQNRRHIDPVELEQIANSIKTTGLVEPIIVGPLLGADGQLVEDRYRIIAGERRWRATKLAGLSHINAIIRHETLTKAVQFAENHYRAQLLPFDLAETIKGVKDEEGITGAAFAVKYKMNRSTVYELLSLVEGKDLPPEFLRTASEAGILVGEAGEGGRRRRVVANQSITLLLTRYYQALMEEARRSSDHGEIPNLKRLGILRHTEALLTRALSHGWTAAKLKTHIDRKLEGLTPAAAPGALPESESSDDNDPATPSAPTAPRPPLAPPLLTEDAQRGRLIVHVARLRSNTQHPPASLAALATRLEELAAHARSLLAAAPPPGDPGSQTPGE